jgi:hypothetical protein
MAVRDSMVTWIIGTTRDAVTTARCLSAESGRSIISMRTRPGTGRVIPATPAMTVVGNTALEFSVGAVEDVVAVAAVVGVVVTVRADRTRGPGAPPLCGKPA